MAQKKVKPTNNPLLQPWRAHFGLPPLAKIKPKHFPPAMRHVLKEHKDAVGDIAKNPSRPSFANTVVALEKSSLKVDKVTSVFFNLAATDSNDELLAIERKFAPVLAAHYSAIYLNPKLFKRIEELHQRRAELNLTKEEVRLIERYYTWFKRAGAGKTKKQKTRIAEINKRLAEHTTQFLQNVLVDEQGWVLKLKTKKDLAGLPETFLSTAKQTAKELGLKGSETHAVTLSRSSVEGFLTFSSRRDLREEAFRAWIARGDNNNKTDNKKIIREVIALRAELAEVLGYDTYAEYALEDTMAGTPNAARELLDKVWPLAVDRANREKDILASHARSEGENFKIASWDWRYFAEKVRKAKFDIDESELRPYFELDNIIAAAFDTAGKLFGLTFNEHDDIATHHPDVRVFDVRDKKGAQIALFLADYFARPSKRSGAWMSSFRSQHKLSGDVRPIVVNVMNFARGSGR